MATRTFPIAVAGQHSTSADAKTVSFVPPAEHTRILQQAKPQIARAGDIHPTINLRRSGMPLTVAPQQHDASGRDITERDYRDTMANNLNTNMVPAGNPAVRWWKFYGAWRIISTSLRRGAEAATSASVTRTMVICLITFSCSRCHFQWFSILSCITDPKISSFADIGGSPGLMIIVAFGMTINEVIFG